MAADSRSPRDGKHLEVLGYYNPLPEPNRRTPKFIEKAKENIEKMMSPDHHHKETHGVSDDIDENTSIDEIKAPNIFERAKEEIEAVIQTFIPEKGQN